VVEVYHFSTAPTIASNTQIPAGLPVIKTSLASAAALQWLGPVIVPMGKGECCTSPEPKLPINTKL